MINPISMIGEAGKASGIQAPTMAPTGGMPSAGPLGGAPDSGFGDAIGNAITNVQQAQGVADGLAQQAATGTLTDIHDYMIASTQAQLATELTVAVRNRALESFQQVMSMQV